MKLKAKFLGEVRAIRLTEDLIGEAGQILLVGEKDELSLFSEEEARKFFHLGQETKKAAPKKKVNRKGLSRAVGSVTAKILGVFFDPATSITKNEKLSSGRIYEILGDEVKKNSFTSLLNTLKNSGYLKAETIPPPNGHFTKGYSITPKGQARLRKISRAAHNAREDKES